MPWQGGVDKRMFPRVNYPCVVRIREKGSAQAFNTETENIGCGGVCVMLPKNIGMFSNVEMEIEVTDEKRKIHCDGTVVWIVRRGDIKKDKPESFDTGIEFTNLKEEDNSIIDKVVRECLKKNKY
jgi:Tfp pilus assembly protein PilZ